MTDYLAVGDYVRVVIEGEIQDIDSRWITLGDGQELNRDFAKSIEKIDRPRPPLPTKVGTLIEANGKHYFLTENPNHHSGIPLWLTSHGSTTDRTDLSKTDWKLIVEGK